MGVETDRGSKENNAAAGPSGAQNMVHRGFIRILYSCVWFPGHRGGDQGKRNGTYKGYAEKFGYIG